MENVDNNGKKNAYNKKTFEDRTKLAKFDEPNIMCNVCLCQENVQSNINWENQSKKMKALSNAKFSLFFVKVTVRVKIPDVERGRNDSRNIFMPVFEQTDDDF